MGTVNPNKTGLMFAVLLGGWHLLWAMFVAAGWAQAAVNFVFWMHFINPVYLIQPFNLGVALTLITVTSVFGYLIGYMLGFLWKWMHKSTMRETKDQESTFARKVA